MNAILVVCDDLIFSSRIAATGAAHGLTVTTARSGDAAVRKAEADPPTCLVVDLHTDKLDLPAMLARMPKAYVVAFGAHVDAATLDAARGAGCDLVMPRSRFHKTLESDLPTWARGG